MLYLLMKQEMGTLPIFPDILGPCLESVDSSIQKNGLGFILSLLFLPLESCSE